jgi:hypothetical protein
MIENEAKGWHGSYSSVGRISAENYPMILMKDQILKGRYKKKKMKDYFSTEEEITNKIILDEGEDIFRTDHKTKIKLKKRKKEICKPDLKKNIPEEYKYHNLHHKEYFNYTQRIKNQIDLSSTAYDPKKDFIWAKTITGPQWKSICGREKGGIFKSEITSFTPTNKTVIKNINPNNLNTFYSLRRGVPMNKMTQRGKIPTFYDLRIRNDRPFNINSKTMDVKNNINVFNRNKLSELNLISNTDNSYKQTTDQTHTSKNNKFKKNTPSSPSINHTINFAKNLSREQYNYVRRNREGVRPFFNPKYNLVEPRSLTMVSYNKKSKGKSIPKRLEGIDINVFYDPDKIINKINNHRENSVPLFKYMQNKNDEEGKFPSHMFNIFNRGSLQIMTEKGLKMNNFSKVNSKNNYSTFCQKKSFNKIINYELLKNEKMNEENKSLKNLAKKFGNNQRLKNMMEFYSKNLDDDKIQYTGNKFDSITLKSIKLNGKLNQKEKKLFSINFTN